MPNPRYRRFQVTATIDEQPRTFVVCSEDDLLKFDLNKTHIIGATPLPTTKSQSTVSRL